MTHPPAVCIVRGMDTATLTATMTSSNGYAVVTLADGRTYRAKDGGRLVQNLDRHMRADRIVRDDRWTVEGDALVTTVVDLDRIEVVA